VNYYDAMAPYALKNLTKQLDGPTLVRVDINVPVRADGRISRDKPNLRLKNYGMVLDLYSGFSPLVVTAHQGRRGDRDFAGLDDHATILGNIVRHGKVKFEPYVEGEEYFTPKLAKRIRSLQRGDVLLLDNVRNFDFEEKFDPSNCYYIPFFRKAGIKTCVNDGLPLWHRDNSSVMALPHIAPTYIGIPSYNELELQYRLMDEGGSKAIIIGGKKPKFEAIPKLAEGMDIFTGGVTAFPVCMIKGCDIGNKNEGLVKKLYSPESIKLLAQMEGKHNIETPVDFVAVKNSEKAVVQIDELKGTDWVIKDIGPATVEKYAELLQQYDWRIRAGPMGVFEEGYNNGAELVRRIVNGGFVAVGGDTVEELQENDLCDSITAAGGTTLLGGGAHLDGWAGEPYPSLDEILRMRAK